MQCTFHTRSRTKTNLRINQKGFRDERIENHFVRTDRRNVKISKNRHHSETWLFFTYLEENLICGRAGSIFLLKKQPFPREAISYRKKLSAIDKKGRHILIYFSFREKYAKKKPYIPSRIFSLTVFQYKTILSQTVIKN